jgi:hypothetical protein
VTTNPSECLPGPAGQIVQMTIGLEHIQLRTQEVTLNFFGNLVRHDASGMEMGTWRPDQASIEFAARFVALLPDTVARSIAFDDGRLTLHFPEGGTLSVVPDSSGDRIWEARAKDWAVTCWPDADGTKVFSDVVGDVALPGDTSGSYSRPVEWNSEWVGYTKLEE